MSVRRLKIRFQKLVVLLFIFGISLNAFGASEPVMVTFPAQDGVNLQGYLYRPAGKGPFPALLYNHGSGQRSNAFADLGKFYTERGFIFFAPYRRGHGPSVAAGSYIRDDSKALRAQGLTRKQVAAGMNGLHEAANRDVIAALTWLKKQKDVDVGRIAISGISYGGIQTLLASEQDALQRLGVKAFVAFAPAAMSWNPALGGRLEKAVRTARAPLFIIQAENDFGLDPSKVLGPILDGKGGKNRHKLYPAFGSSQREGHGKFAVDATGIQIWGTDVMAFLKDCGMN